nr:uncharacterized protein LOC112492573 [Ziziphus jujuba var. spinosa]
MASMMMCQHMSDDVVLAWQMRWLCVDDVAADVVVFNLQTVRDLLQKTLGSASSHLQSKNVREGTVGKRTAVMVATIGRLKVELDYATGRPTNDKISSIVSCAASFTSKQKNRANVPIFLKDKHKDRWIFLMICIIMIKKGWINETAQQRYEDMHQRRTQLLEEGLETVNEDAIANEVLGTSSGYIPGMGYGPKPTSYSHKRQPSLDTIALHERISSLEEEYDSYKQQNEERLSSLKDEYEEKMLKYEEEITKMREFIQQFMDQSSCSGDGTSFARFRFPPPPPPPPSAAC